VRRLLALLFGKIIHYLLELKQCLYSLRPLQVIPVKLAENVLQIGWSSGGMKWLFSNRSLVNPARNILITCSSSGPRPLQMPRACHHQQPECRHLKTNSRRPWTARSASRGACLGVVRAAVLTTRIQLRHRHLLTIRLAAAAGIAVFRPALSQTGSLEMQDHLHETHPACRPRAFELLS